ncbi:outer membrane protein assembly factor BamD [Flavobacterium gilvum]|uniref:Outer membrane protein assembly factor BamD n=1 Tax=Flavobacterium gilvum TaxID=1492737 RepID=A0AAC9I4G1_9FLAO|nr:outer membrane protein assembly factor BamD [Flavobacterium gilvum]AOW10689.1 outer membrane protein assembly factor BamD [Flavobacterium gilvum]KFC60321.1 DNA uptake lipoprotein-like protein [Flavobacterium gilvum]
MKKIISVLFVVLFLGSCSDYQAALKTEDPAVKYDLASKFYESGKYSKAIRLFEQLAPSYRGKPQGEKLFYMFAQSYYKTKQYYLAGYQFDSFNSGYPRSEKAEECAFLGAESYSKLSPVYSIDQTDTFKAIEKIQGFIDRFPNSKYVAQANEISKKLNEKIERKVYENALEYNRISNYKSAIIAFDNFIADYPGTVYKEKALYYKLDSAYLLAINSVPSKMEERLNTAKTSYNNLMKYKPDTEYKKKADEMLAQIEVELQKYNTNK